MLNIYNLPKIWDELLNSSKYLPIIIKSIEKFHDKDWSMAPNTHDCFELLYFKQGDATFIIGHTHVNLGPNDIIIIKPNTSHKFVVNSKKGCETVVLNFKLTSQKNSITSEASCEDFLKFVNERDSGDYIKLKVSQKNNIILLLNKIISEKKDLEIGSEFLTYLLTLELFVYLSRALKMEWELSLQNKNIKLNELIDVSVVYIQNNFERDISLTDISNYIFLSQSYFNREFKSRMGITPISYLLKLRIERSKELLKETNLKVGQIALTVGFSNQQRFNEHFKKLTGLSATQFRNPSSP